MWTSRSLTTVEGTKDGKVQGWWLLLWSPGGMYLWPGQQATIVIIKHWSLEWCGKCDVNLGRIRDPSYWNYGTMDGFQIHNQLISRLAFFLFFPCNPPTLMDSTNAESIIIVWKFPQHVYSLTLAPGCIAVMFFVVCSSRDSIKHEDENKPACGGTVPMDVFSTFDSDVKITYTYSVSFEVGFHNICVCVWFCASVCRCHWCLTWINSL